MSSRIEQIIQEIEEYVDSCKFQPLSTTKIVVNKEEIEEYLRELRLKTPDEIKRYQEILDSATQDANSIRLSAITYTDDMMANIGSVLNQTLEDAGGKYKAFIDALQSCLEVVNHNRQELAPQTAQAAAISNTFQDDDSSSITKEDEDLLDDIGEN